MKLNGNSRFAVFAFCAVVIAGCQTRITATRNPETVSQLNGKSVVLSGGWEFTARSPLWATETLKGLSIDVGSGDNHVGVSLNDYSRDLSTNAVAVVDKLTAAAIDLTGKVCAAVVSGGGSPAIDGIASLVKRYISAGGDAANATIECKDGSCTISDGSVACSGSSCSE